MDLSLYKSRELVPLTCTHCKEDFKRVKNQVQKDIKKGTLPFCSRECYRLYIKTTEKNCRNPSCVKFFKPSSSNQKFCSKSCAATYNNSNRRNKKRDRREDCQCGGKKGHKAAMCKTCFSELKLVQMGERTLADIDGAKQGYKGTHRWNRVRKHARHVVKLANIEKKCELCDFDIHVEVCHIKPVASFPFTATLAEVNHLGNLRVLCPNHHKMFDKGFL